jgi:hypothetical protein
MGGGGGGGTFFYRSPSELSNQVRRAEERTAGVAFEAELARVLGNLLGSYNSRDSVAANQRLDELKGLLEEHIDGSFDQLFGGSVAKHTYVEGLSDVDSLIVIDDCELADAPPRTVLSTIDRILTRRLRNDATVTHGRMAVTIDYGDGMVIQLLPALVGAEGRLKVPSSRAKGWSRIDPVAFQQALTRRNQECAGKLVPTIKLAKAINGQLPERQRLSGYHIESLGIAAFKDYDGSKTTAAMLPVLFEKARDLVLRPIRDRTGQSVHVDDYLGSAGSPARFTASHIIGRLARRMRNATAAESEEQWLSLFGMDT